MESYTSDSSDSDNSAKIIDLAYLLLDSTTVDLNLEVYFDNRKRSSEIENIVLHHNQLSSFPENIFRFSNLNTLDLSNNGLRILPDVLRFCPLVSLIAKNNSLTDESLPKSFSEKSVLRELNLSGNSLRNFPEQICELVNLKYLYLGGNKIGNISRNIYKLTSIQILSLGGNEIVEVPSILGQLTNLHILSLCDNKIETLPAHIANLHNLKSLQLHKNRLKVLPPEIIALKNLTELSLRDNPLVVQFVTEMCNTPASLLELAARVIKLHKVVVIEGDIPKTLINYLNSAHHCVNPRCKGVYFDNRVEHIKFVDFCGKYRIPLLQYLCSSKCRKGSKEEMVRPSRSYMMKKVLLG
ncbi:leucine-rich repeat-containing protein 58 [Coccinella septempunctata]|uniref:leucine-rich repeat-containing protein 58 n=1 Tax=Coccinella septempunctata TaxID=41139 RepID=UPI001D0735FB|nr:leucine-rich repeat-containing protein 58 [Coccinella septempunctata]